MKQRHILCDAGSFISLTSTCMDNLIYFFAENHNVSFIIPPSVEYEAVTRPLDQGYKKYMFSAIRIKDLINDKVVAISDVKAPEEAKELMRLANNLFFVGGKPMQLMHLGEAEMLAIAKRLGISHILIDERTTRMIIEAPFSIKEHFEKEFHTNVMLNKKNLAELSKRLEGLYALRSSELIILAYENGFFKRFQDMEKEALKAALYKVKYSGCSIRFNEIDDYFKWRK
ncbi:MAG: hypothetical protein ABII71_01750 [Candidatus Micrarchaeota archaeon]